MFKRLFCAALVFGAAALAPPAHAQGITCLSREVLVERLENRYKEHLIGGGLQNSLQLLEVWASGETGSFTVFVTRPDGISCIVATGQHWNNGPRATPEGVAG